MRYYNSEEAKQLIEYYGDKITKYSYPTVIKIHWIELALYTESSNKHQVLVLGHILQGNIYFKHNVEYVAMHMGLPLPNDILTRAF